MKYAVLLIAVCITGLFLASCDGGITLEGTVYEWTDAPTSLEGIIYIDEEVDLSGKNLQPLNEIQLSTTYSAETARSDSTGYIYLDDMGAPGFMNVTLTAEKEGYHTVAKSFSHKGSNLGYNVIIIMVRDE
ncbi:MAG: hypothetical protein HN929_05040 [Chloroflexi bacterium]|nr:hypothetical protein [Chloroflexota bacterium]MBT7080818.1 hypothetical protein [Chloroflexota bacterium]MBT7289713.1 hypothetical protein [Chloroflexota bacterium]